MSFCGPKYSFCLKMTLTYVWNKYAKKKPIMYYKLFEQSLQLFEKKIILYFVRKWVIHRKLL